jgi:NADPH:quinone reductase-like Zn-dependent oxidoreductase
MRNGTLALLTLLLLACGQVAAAKCETPTGAMDAVRLGKYGSADELRVERVPLEPPAAGELLVRVRASSVNPIDWKIREGYATALWPLTLPATLGLDVAGVVAAVGEGVEGWTCGDEIVAYLGQHGRGAYAEYVRVPQTLVARKPARASWAEAGALPLVGLTAWQALVVHGGLRDGERVLVLGGSGGVGSAAVQIAKARGAHVTATASAANAAFVRALGADEVIDYRSTEVDRAVSGIDLVLDTVGGEATASGAATLREGGRLISIAGALPSDRCAARRLDCRDMLVQPDAGQLAELGRLVDAGRLRVPIERTYPLARVADAQRENQRGRTRGKIAIVLEPAAPPARR